ncbi:probable E3 ubiquitin-protein ligase XERICO [Rutidosis leptorrhynchoides]|uniref:probable E3 ubiquitin-protein ligase XERICO n=1 Tax=Rutidosis leptorrhynchoides TaxID=125765 RepID=UPI003A9A4F90
MVVYGGLWVATETVIQQHFCVVIDDCSDGGCRWVMVASRKWLIDTDMGLSPYSNPSDAGILCVILVKTAMSLSIMKELLRSILHVIGIRMTSSDEVSVHTLVESHECRGSPSKIYMEEFRSRTPTLRYDSLSCTTKQECSVCLIEFKPDAKINRLSCGHVFHKSCLEKWLNYWNITCPLCRNDMMAPKDTEENTCPM